MPDKNEKREVTLQPGELLERAEGQQLHEMTQTPGFDILRKQLEAMAFHSWVDPREIVGEGAKKEWEWRELNAFHASNNAKELLEWIQKKVTDAEYLEKKRRGDLRTRSLRIN